MRDATDTERAAALADLTAEWGERNQELIALQQEARRLASRITTVQRRMAALQQTAAAIVATPSRPVVTAAHFT